MFLPQILMDCVWPTIEKRRGIEIEVEVEIMAEEEVKRQECCYTRRGTLLNRGFRWGEF